MNEVVTYRETKDNSFSGNYMFDLSKLNEKEYIYYLSTANLSSNKDIKIKAAELMVEATRETSALSAYLISPLTQKYKEWDPWCIVNKDWNVEIVEDGTYIIQAFTQFIFPSTPNNWYQYSENVALLKFKNGGWVKQVATQWRVCANLGNSDQLGTTYSWWLNKWTIFTVGSSHTYGSVITLYQVMNIQRLA